MKKAFAYRISTTIAVLACTLAATAAFAGPPLICWRVETGGAKSLPWLTEGSAFDGSRADYDRSRLVRDTLDLLAPDVPVVVRMETLRRAALYAARD